MKRRKNHYQGGVNIQGRIRNLLKVGAISETFIKLDTDKDPKQMIPDLQHWKHTFTNFQHPQT
jgi:hypothetical protein